MLKNILNNKSQVTYVNDKTVSKIYKELLHISKRTDNPVEKLAKHMNRHLTEKERQMRNKYMRIYST